ncbi:MAG: hypothetical protein ABEN55_10870, partial [Bradymonadaceae bacterium]
CFIREAFGQTEATPQLKIKKVVERGDHTCIVANRLDTLETIGLCVIENLTRPESIRAGDETDEILPRGQSYYWPKHMDFVELGSRASLADEEDRVREGRDDRPIATLRKNANWYHLDGQTKTGSVQERMMDENEMRMKLAALSCDDQTIEKACEMEGGKMELRGLRPCRLKVASQDDPVSLPPAQRRQAVRKLQKEAQKAMEGYDAAIERSQPKASEKAEDPDVMDTILSIQFVDEDTLREIVDSERVFRESEDKIARLLIAARRGVDGLHERGLKRALKGLGAVRDTLTTLKIELDSREP